MKDTIFGLSGRAAFVTGGGKGLGKSIAGALARAGAEIVISGRHENDLRAAANEIHVATGQRVEYVVCDLTERGDIGRLVSEAIDKVGRIDILVNNAGANIPQAIEVVRDLDWDYLLELNLSSCMALSRALCPGMMERCWGRIIHISSIMGMASTNRRSAYSATKSALFGLSKACAMDLAKYNITVNCIAPGPFATEMPLANLTKEQWDSLASRTALNRFGDPAEIEGPVLLLASNAGSYITGSVLLVDGGAMAKAF